MSDLTLTDPSVIAGAWFLRESLAALKWAVEKYISSRKEIAKENSKSDTEKLLSKAIATIAEVNAANGSVRETLEKNHTLIKENKNNEAEIWRHLYDDLIAANKEAQEGNRELQQQTLIALAGNRDLLSLALTSLETYDKNAKNLVDTLANLTKE